MLTKRVILFMLECLTVCFVGCRQEADTNEIAKLPADTTDREIQEALNLVTNWQSHFDLLHVNRSPFALELSNKIAFGIDDAVYGKYMGRFIDAAFSIPTDAEDSGARLQQLDSFCTMTMQVIWCAEAHRDWDTYWTIALRRLERIRDEMQRLKIRFPEYASQSDDLPCLGRGGWDNCLKLVKQEYEMEVSGLPKALNNVLMTLVLSYEKWSDIRSQLETIIGHEVEIKESILNLWEEKRKKEQAQSMK